MISFIGRPEVITNQFGVQCMYFMCLYIKLQFNYVKHDLQNINLNREANNNIERDPNFYDDGTFLAQIF